MERYRPKANAKVEGEKKGSSNADAWESKTKLMAENFMADQRRWLSGVSNGGYPTSAPPRSSPLGKTFAGARIEAKATK